METFETYRPYLFSVAYSMLGSAMDAEDMVQETYVRYQNAAPSDLRSLKAYLTTILTRLCVDQLNLARRQREVYVGPWLPEPILTEAERETVNPEERVDTQESVSLAFLVLLEQLQPFERAVFLLRETFEYEFAEIAGILSKSEAACRKSFSRSKEHLRQHRPRFSASPEEHRELLASFIQAVETGEMQSLMSLLAEDVVLWADSGGKGQSYVLNAIHGPEHVARLALRSQRFAPPGFRIEIAEVNGEPAIVARGQEGVFSVITLEVGNGKIQAVRVMANPEKLRHI